MVSVRVGEQKLVFGGWPDGTAPFNLAITTLGGIKSVVNNGIRDQLQEVDRHQL